MDYQTQYSIRLILFVHLFFGIFQFIYHIPKANNQNILTFQLYPYTLLISLRKNSKTKDKKKWHFKPYFNTNILGICEKTTGETFKDEVKYIVISKYIIEYDGQH